MEKVLSHAEVSNLPAKKKVPSLRELLKKEEDIKEFYQFVYENNLRVQALAKLSERISE